MRTYKSQIVVAIVCVLFAIRVQAQSTFSFNNRPGGPVDAPVYDSQGGLLSGPNYVAELYGGLSSMSLSPTTDLYSGTRFIMAFRTGVNAGYWFPNIGEMTVWTPSPGSYAWLQVRAWDVRLGATYEDVVASGLGGYGESTVFYGKGGDPTLLPAEFPQPLIGLQSFSLRPVVPEPSALALVGLGGLSLWWAVHRKRGP